LITPTRLPSFRILSFDCYGTLIDWETGILAALQPLTGQIGDPLTEQEILEAFGRRESELEAANPATPYSTILEQVFTRLAAEWGLDNGAADAEAFGASVGDWPAFPDSREALLFLKRHYSLAILSNVDRASFARSQARLGVDFDFVFTAEDVGSYKPSLRNFEYMLDKLAVARFGKEDILHTAQSLFHDHEPANRMGLRSAWINRQAGRPGATPALESMPGFDFEFPTLSAMASAVELAFEDSANLAV